MNGLRLLSVFFDVRYSITYSTNLLSLVIRNRDTEFFFEFHDKFYSVKRICSQVVSEACFVSNFDSSTPNLSTIIALLLMQFQT